MWATAVVFVVFWMLGLLSGYTLGVFIHMLYIIAIVLLLIGLKQEVGIYRELNRTLYNRKCRRLTSGRISL